MAQQVEVEIRYDNQQFRLRVRDDGRGMDTAVLSGQGREGHFGLRGMRERARLIGGKLVVWSEVGAGHRSGTDCSCFLRIHDNSEGFVAVAKVCGESMIAIRPNTARALRRSEHGSCFCA